MMTKPEEKPKGSMQVRENARKGGQKGKDSNGI